MFFSAENTFNGIFIGKDGSISIDGATDDKFNYKLDAAYDFADNQLIIGNPSGSNIKFDSLIINSFFNNLSGLDFGIVLRTEKATFTINSENFDSFLSKIFQKLPLELQFNFGVGFSKKRNFFLFGSSTDELKIRRHINLGILNINSIKY